MSRLVLGVDPGALTGAWAILDGSGALLAVDDLPTIADRKTRWVDAPALISCLLEVRAGRPVQAFVERQGARPGQGLSSTFVSACAFGSLLATLQIAGCSIELVTAPVWKGALGLSNDKQQSLDRARLLYPDSSAFERKKDHGRAEAALIATYGLRSRTKAQEAAA